MSLITVDFWIVMDEDGDYVVSHDRDAALELYSDEIGGSGALRVVHSTVMVRAPKTESANLGAIPDEAGEVVAGE